MRRPIAFCIAISTVGFLETAPCSSLAAAEAPLLPAGSAPKKSGATVSTPSTVSFREILASSEISLEALAGIPAGSPTAETPYDLINQILFRLNRLDPRVLEHSVMARDPRQLTQAEPSLHGELVELRGRVVHVDALAPRSERAAETEPLFRCVVQLEEMELPATIWTRRVPSVWTAHDRLHERISVRGAFAGINSDPAGQTAIVVLAPRVAWHPDAEGQAVATPGRRFLGEMGVDVGQLEEVRHGLRLTRSDREPFYSLLSAVHQADSDRLFDLARAAVAEYAEPWQQQEEQRTNQRKLLAQTVIRAASEGRYSVAPLFLDSENQTGQLLLLEGLVRRAVRIEIADPPPEFSNRTTHRSLDHYFELELFTSDSQNLPLVCCVPSLPGGFPLGDEVRERVRLSGFFLKRWRYDSRSLREAPTGPHRFEPTAAPLLVAAQPRWPLPQEASLARDVLGWLTGGLFVVVVGVICFTAWRWSLSDRQFRRRMNGPNHRPEAIAPPPDRGD